MSGTHFNFAVARPSFRRGFAHARCLVLLLLVPAASAAAAGVPSYPLADATTILWQGRYLRAPDGSGSVLADVEGVSFTATVADARVIALVLNDTSAGGARLSVTLTAPGIPTFRVATLVTSPLQSVYTLASGAALKNATATVTVTLLSEWENIGDSLTSPLRFVALATDGALQPAPARPARRLLVLGDSLSAGVGCGFDVPPTGAACGSGVLLNDVSRNYDFALCANFSAECEVVAGSGITIVARPDYNLPLVFPWSLGAMASDAWPAAQRVAWPTRTHVPDAIILTIGSNDCHTFDCTGKDLQTLKAAYVSFVQNLTLAYAVPSLPVFLTIAMHESGQSKAMLLAVDELVAAGYKAAFLNATAPDVLPDGTPVATGCGGHPSAQANALAAARARPVIAAALGW